MWYKDLRQFYQEQIAGTRRYSSVHVLYSIIRALDPDRDVSHPYSTNGTVPLWWPPQVPYKKLSALQDQGTALAIIQMLNTDY